MLLNICIYKDNGVLIILKVLIILALFFTQTTNGPYV